MVHFYRPAEFPVSPPYKQKNACVTPNFVSIQVLTRLSTPRHVRYDLTLSNHAFLRRFVALPPSSTASGFSVTVGLVASLSVNCSMTRPESS